MIPNIIHQTGPIEEKWHPIWKECQRSWKEKYSDFEYKFWTDEDLRNLIKEKYTSFLNLYDNFPLHIMRVDFARFCILHSYGGIYADLDIFCYKNFYDLLKNDLYLIESWPQWGEKVQNSLMISTKNHPFWEKCIILSLLRYEYSQKTFTDRNDFILNCFGPKLISKILDPTVKYLPKELFNPPLENQFNWGNDDEEKYKNALKDFSDFKSEKNVFTRHFLTGIWSY